MNMSVGQEITNSMPTSPGQTDEEVLHDAEMTQAEADQKFADSTFAQPVPIQAAAVIESGPCTLVVTSINHSRKRDCLVAKVHAMHKGTGGFSDFTFCVPLAQIRKIASQIMRVRHGVEIGSTEIGSILDDIGDAVSSAANDIAGVASDVVNATGIGEVVKGVSAIANLPGFKQALGVGGMIFPPLGVSLSAINSAGNLISKASAGNQQAKSQIFNVMQQGWNNASPAAVKAATTLSSVYQAKQAMDAQAPLLTRTINNAIQVSLLPTATDRDKALVQELFNFFSAIANGPLPTEEQLPGYFPDARDPSRQHYGVPGRLPPGMMPMKNQNYQSPPPSQGNRDYNSGGTHVVISGWPIERVKRLRKALIGAGWLNLMVHVPGSLSNVYNSGSRLMLAGC